MRIVHTLLAALSISVLSMNVASAAIDIVISPAPGDPTKYVLSATGTGTVVGGSGSDNGRLLLDGIAAITSNASPATGLSFGGVGVRVATPPPEIPQTQYFFELDAPLSAGSAYSFTGGPILVSIGTPTGYENHFNPGTYNIISSTGIFGETTTGTLTINAAVPEPSQTAIIGGFLALCLLGLRRRS